jgi:hypothetical protein
MIVLDNRYSLEGILRDASWSRLYQGRDLELKRSIDVREVSFSAVASDPEVRRYVVSAFGLSQLNHPGYEQVISIRRSDAGNIYIICDSVASLSLKGLLTRLDQIDFPPELALYVLGEAARALAAAHLERDRQTGQPRNLLHLGISPETIQLSETGQVRLVGFALPSAGEIKTSDRVAYLSPEQIQGGEVDQRSDLFSLAVVGYELLTGRRLFQQENTPELMATIVRGNYDLSALTTPSLDSRVGLLITSCLKAKKNERLGSAIEFADRANQVIQDKLQAPEKRIRELVEKFAESPKLETYSDAGRQMVRTRVLTRDEFEKGTKAMSDQSQNGPEGRKNDRPGQETRISNVPYTERLKRAKRGGLGGSKTVLVLMIVAVLLLSGIGIILVTRIVSKGPDSGPTAAEMKSGTVATIPDSATVYRGDSLIGRTPLTFSASEGETVVIKHQCCPDSQVVVDFDRFSAGPIRLQSTVEISSNPLGATITLNGKSVDATAPYRFRAAPVDTVQFTLEIPGKPMLSSGPIVVSEIPNFSAKSFEVAQLGHGAYQVSGLFTDKPRTQIVTLPSEATVTVAATGVVLGTTPLSLDFGDESSRLTITKSGYEDQTLDLPSLVSRKLSYRLYLYRRVSVTAYDERDPEKRVSSRIKSVSYDGKTNSNYTETTPASLRLPGVDCRISLSADGYHNTDTLIAATQSEIAVVMRPVPKVEKQEKEKEQPVVSSTENRKQVKIIVIDNKQTAVEGAVVTAEVTRDKKKQTLELGKTDKEGMLRQNLEPGKYKFIASHPDYKGNDEKQEIKANDANGNYVVTIKIKRK